MVVVVFYPWMGLLISEDLMISDRLLLGRCLYNVTFYLLIICVEYFLQKKKALNKLYLLAILLGGGQISIMYCMYMNDPAYLASKSTILSLVYSAIIILGYFNMNCIARR